MGTSADLPAGAFGQDNSVESSDLPPLHIRELQAIGVRALTNGLSAFPAQFTQSTTTPLAYWKSERFGFGVILQGSPHVESQYEPKIWTGGYVLRSHEWIPTGHWMGQQGKRNIEGTSEQSDDLEHKPIGWEGRVIKDPDEEGPGLIVWGWCSSKVAQLSLVQNQEIIRIPIGHLGRWVVGSELSDPYRVEALDGSGNIVGFVNQGFP